jgi:hypothetical protein
MTNRRKVIERAVEPVEARPGDLWYRLHHEVWVPNNEAIVRIWNTACAEQPKGGIVVAVFELLDPEGPRGPGWDLESPVFRLTPEKAGWFAQNLERLSPGDGAIQWLRTPRFARTLLFIQGGTLLDGLNPSTFLRAATVLPNASTYSRAPSNAVGPGSWLSRAMKGSSG